MRDLRFLSSENRICGLLDGCAMWCSGWRPLFWTTLLPPSSGLQCVVNGKWADIGLPISLSSVQHVGIHPSQCMVHESRKPQIIIIPVGRSVSCYSIWVCS